MDYKTTAAKRRANKKYDEKMERINCRFEPGTLERIRNTGSSSANNYIKIAVAEKLERDERILNIR